LRQPGPLLYGAQFEEERLSRNEWDLPEIGLRRLSAADMRRFWDIYLAAKPDIRYGWGNVFSRWRAVPGTELNLSLYITNRSVGLFVRGRRGMPLSATRVELAPRAAELERMLGARIDDEAPLLRKLRLTTNDPSTWQGGHEWLRASEADYLAALAP
jgi:hypothetical protein